MRNAELPLLQLGDVIKTHPAEGYWGCAVVVWLRKRCSEFDPLCLIAITPTIFRHDYIGADLRDVTFSILEYEQGIKFFPGDSRSRRVTCLGWYDARPNPDFDVVGSVDPRKFFTGSTRFIIGDGTGKSWPLCGRIHSNLGSEAVLAWRSLHAPVSLAGDLEAADASHWALMDKLKSENRAKRKPRRPS